MGNSFTCFSPTPTNSQRKSKPSSNNNNNHLPPWLSPSFNIKSKKIPSPSFSSPSNFEEKKMGSSKTQIFDDSYIKEQARIASMLYQHHLQNNSDLLLNLERSVSTKNPPSFAKKYKQLSKRSRSVSHANPLSLDLSNQDVSRSEGAAPPAERKHFVLVHGGGFGAWCWYKIIALLRDGRSCEVDTIDLTGSGLNNFCDINSITTLREYSKPLTDFLEELPDGEKVILVGHDIGGACVSHAMELYPSKVSKAIFVAATMLTNGQSALNVFSQQSTTLNDLSQRAQKFLYANGKNCPPTAIDFDKSLLEDFLFNRTSSKDIALASVSMRAVPFAPVAEKLSLSATNYGSIPRFYIKTDEDLAIPMPLQESMIQSDPPKQVFELKGSDHSPFFSRPQALHRLLSEISDIP